MSDGAVEKVSVDATIKKVNTTADKGGTVIVHMEIANGAESAEIFMKANSTCKMILDFTNGQMELPMDEKEE